MARNACCLATAHLARTTLATRREIVVARHREPGFVIGMSVAALDERSVQHELMKRDLEGVLLAEVVAQLLVGAACVTVGLGVLWLARGEPAFGLDHNVVAILGATVLLGLGGAGYATVKLVRP